MRSQTVNEMTAFSFPFCYQLLRITIINQTSYSLWRSNNLSRILLDSCLNIVQIRIDMILITLDLVPDSIITSLYCLRQSCAEFTFFIQTVKHLAAISRTCQYQRLLLAVIDQLQCFRRICCISLDLVDLPGQFIGITFEILPVSASVPCRYRPVPALSAHLPHKP